MRVSIKSLAAVATCATAFAVVPGALLTPASAGGILPSATVVTATPSDDGTSVLLSATVKVLKVLPGLLVTATGTVDFTNNNGTGTDLGTATVGACLLTPCVATVKVPVGQFTQDAGQTFDTVKASYSSDVLSTASDGTTEIGLGLCPDAQGNCDDATATSGDTSVDVTTDGQGTLLASLGGPASPCSVTNGGPIINVSGSGLDADKTITITYTGAAAKAYENLNTKTGHDYMCYVSPNGFQAFSNKGKFNQNANDFTTFGDAPKITTGAYLGDFVGLLPDCTNGEEGDGIHSDIVLDGDQPPPCISADFSPEGSPGTLIVEIDAPASDPHPGGG
jgi:hypothetical protein